MAYCSSCGSMLPDEAIFCPSCGTKKIESPLTATPAAPITLKEIKSSADPPGSYYTGSSDDDGLPAPLPEAQLLDSSSTPVTGTGTTSRAGDSSAPGADARRLRVPEAASPTTRSSTAAFITSNVGGGGLLTTGVVGAIVMVIFLILGLVQVIMVKNIGTQLCQGLSIANLALGMGGRHLYGSWLFGRP